MSCCGKAKRVVGKAVNIAKGYIADSLGIRYEFTDGRVRICQKCEYNTWLTRHEYNAWLFGNGISVIKEFIDLTVLGDLPDGKQGPGKVLCCKKCKCKIPKKARVEEEKCPLDKWSK